ncbi:hypothetical protein Tco_1165248 [Tanacetum coccineum]
MIGLISWVTKNLLEERILSGLGIKDGGMIIGGGIGTTTTNNNNIPNPAEAGYEGGEMLTDPTPTSKINPEVKRLLLEDLRPVGMKIECELMEPGFELIAWKRVKIETFSFELLEQRFAAIVGYRKKMWVMNENKGCTLLGIDVEELLCEVARLQVAKKCCLGLVVPQCHQQTESCQCRSSALADAATAAAKEGYRNEMMRTADGVRLQAAAVRTNEGAGTLSPGRSVRWGNSEVACQRSIIMFRLLTFSGQLVVL